MNPFASEEEAAARFSNSDGYVSAEHDPRTFYVQMDTDDADTACHLVQLQVEDADDDEAEVEPTPPTRRPKRFRNCSTALSIHDSHFGVRRQ